MSGLASLDPRIVSNKLMRAENDCGPSTISSEADGRSTGERDKASAITLFFPGTQTATKEYRCMDRRRRKILGLSSLSRAMIGDELEGGQAFEKLAAYAHCPSHRQAFQLYHRVPGLCIGQETGSRLDDIPAPIGLLLSENETEAPEVGRIDMK
ncbi:hypothetical protein OUZ56_017667 [Daphnia magna]|uniref:Uncharacterized protein n=1 Tax=Daphnia magna TaxID=35525 RepID=A0ABR0ATD6_9CRUS|nr:hypothetical protein OUZ56_017667 [Daphnia magna]